MTVTTSISTLRHAHTQYNAERRYAGSIDIPLSESGVNDARQAAAKLADVKFDMVITSKLKRAIQTAQLLIGNSTPIIQNELCNERNFGIMEGLTWEDVQTLQPPVLMINVGNDLHTVNPKGGEPFEDVWERAKRFRQLIFQAYAGANILVVSHGVFLQMFHGLLRGLNCIESLGSYPSNLELAKFQFDGEQLVSEKVTRLLGSEPLKW
ncbi:MAG: histidine phosphatase family protein [Chloroflexi bacterium]|nr:histidine phosphatase family protein [Chloroflexota bacterium]